MKEVRIFKGSQKKINKIVWILAQQRNQIKEKVDERMANYWKTNS